MKQRIMTPAQGKELMDGIQAELKAYSLESVIVVNEKTNALNTRDAAVVIREAVLAFEERRLAAGRKVKTADAPPKVEEK